MSEQSQMSPGQKFNAIHSSARALMGGFSGEAIVGGAAAVLAILALAEILPETLAPIATIAVGFALLIKSASVASQAFRIRSELAESPSEQIELGTGMSSELLAGMAGIVLGVLALLGMSPLTMMSIAVIAFGAAMLFGGGETLRISRLGSEMEHGSIQHLAGLAARSAAGAETMVGIGAVVLGILALTSAEPLVFILSGLLILGAAQLITGLMESGRMATLLKF